MTDTQADLVEQAKGLQLQMTMVKDKALMELFPNYQFYLQLQDEYDTTINHLMSSCHLDETQAQLLVYRACSN